MLDPKFLLDEKFTVPKTLRLDHDEIRIALSRASRRTGCVGDAAQRLARIYLPHLDHEEKTIYPAFDLLHEAALSGLRERMAAVFPLVFHYRAWHDVLDHHRSIHNAVDELHVTLRKEQDSEFAMLGENLRNHERIEEDVMHPAMIWIGHYLREQLGCSD